MIVTRKLCQCDLHQNLLSGFDRRQEVRRSWREMDGRWVLVDDPYVDNWGGDAKREVATVDLPGCLRSGGVVWGAFDETGRLVAFAGLRGEAMGSLGQYRKLMLLHVSREWRGKGLGRRLFALCADGAAGLGAEKLYISAHSSEETQAFYRSMGCVDALEPDPWSVGHEPFDRQLEYMIDR